MTGNDVVSSYDGGGSVIEYNDVIVQIVTIEQFVAGGGILEKNSRNTCMADEIIERAYSRIGEKKYNVVINNCEHFALWCRNNGVSQSQIDSENYQENIVESCVMSVEMFDEEFGEEYKYCYSASSKDGSVTVNSDVPCIITVNGK